MLKLKKDRKNIENISINNMKRYKIIGTTNILIFASLFALPHLNFNKKAVSVEPIEYISSSSNSVSAEITYTYDDYLIDQCKDIASYYAHVFNIKEEILLQAAVDNMKNYGVIYVLEKDYDSQDTEMIFLCKDILAHPNAYGENLTRSDVITDEEYIPSLSIREMVYKYADLFNVDRTMALSIACLESYDFTFDIATSKNNPFALRTNDFLIFDNLEEGIIEGISSIKNGYIDKGVTTFESMENIYCPGSDGHWLSLAYDKKYKIENNILVLYDEENMSLTMTR